MSSSSPYSIKGGVLTVESPFPIEALDKLNANENLRDIVALEISRKSSTAWTVDASFMKERMNHYMFKQLLRLLPNLDTLSLKDSCLCESFVQLISCHLKVLRRLKIKNPFDIDDSFQDLLSNVKILDFEASKIPMELLDGVEYSKSLVEMHLKIKNLSKHVLGLIIEAIENNRSLLSVSIHTSKNGLYWFKQLLPKSYKCEYGSQVAIIEKASSDKRLHDTYAFLHVDF